MKLSQMSSEDVVTMLRSDPQHEALVRNCYWGEDRLEAGERFLNSGEFREVQRWLDCRHRDARILDLGSGTGIASFAFARAGAKIVYALDPDPSDVVGRGATRELTAGLPVESLDGVGESIPLKDNSVDIVYARAVLHHANDLSTLMAECARILVPGGLFLATREHVANNARQLEEFWATHPLHRFTQNEYAFALKEYVQALVEAGLRPVHVLGPWDSVINAFPTVESPDELQRLPREMLARKFGSIGRNLGAIAPARRLVFWHLARHSPGRPYSFLAHKGS